MVNNPLQQMMQQGGGDQGQSGAPGGGMMPGQSPMAMGGPSVAALQEAAHKMKGGKKSKRIGKGKKRAHHRHGGRKKKR